MNKQEKYQKEKKLELALIKTLEEEQKNFKKFFEENETELTTEEIIQSLAVLFNVFVNKHEQNYVLFHTNKELYVQFAMFINTIRSGIKLFQHEMLYKPLQAADEKRFLEGEKLKILDNFKNNGSYRYLGTLMGGGFTLILTEFLTPTYRTYEATIEMLTTGYKTKNSLGEALDSLDSFGQIYLLSRVHLLIDIYNFFHIEELLANIEKKTNPKTNENGNNIAENENITHLQNAINENNSKNKNLTQNNVYDSFNNKELAMIYYFHTLDIYIENRKDALTLLFRNKVTNFDKIRDSVDSAFRRINDKKGNERNNYFKANYISLDKITLNIEEGKVKSEIIKIMKITNPLVTNDL